MKELPPKQTIVMDNAAIHKSEKTREIIEKHVHELLFLPPYSPDLNPIEKVFGVLKRALKADNNISLETLIMRKF